jgi:hypothetical protein
MSRNDRVARKQPFGRSPKGGVFATVEEIAAAEEIIASYVGHVLRLTLLAPPIVEAILDGRQPAEMTLAVLMRPFAVGWVGQQMAIRFGPGTSRPD